MTQHLKKSLGLSQCLGILIPAWRYHLCWNDSFLAGYWSLLVTLLNSVVQIAVSASYDVGFETLILISKLTSGENCVCY